MPGTSNRRRRGKKRSGPDDSSPDRSKRVGVRDESDANTVPPRAEKKGKTRLTSIAASRSVKTLSLLGKKRRREGGLLLDTRPWKRVAPPARVTFRRETRIVCPYASPIGLPALPRLGGKQPREKLTRFSPPLEERPT
jgi:hypothetical protein